MLIASPLLIIASDNPPLREIESTYHADVWYYVSALDGNTRPLEQLEQDLKTLPTQATIWLDTDFVGEANVLRLVRATYLPPTSLSRQHVIYLTRLPDTVKAQLDTMPAVGRYAQYRVTESNGVYCIKCWRRPKERLRPYKLSANNAQHIMRIISSEAVGELCADAIVRGAGFAVVRMGDGEAELLRARVTPGYVPWFWQDAGWRSKYGVDGMDLIDCAERVYAAGIGADVIGINLLGLYDESWAAWRYLPPNRRYCDQYVHIHIAATGTLTRLAGLAKTAIIHREAAKLVQEFSRKFRALKPVPIVCNSWRDHDKVYEQAKQSGCKLFLISVGAAGKALGVKIAKELSAVVLDCGEAMGGWYL